MAQPMRSAEIVLVGASGAGKTSLLRQFAVGTFSSTEPQTIGIDCRRRTLSLDRGDGRTEQLRLTCWDAGGLTRFRDMALRYVAGKLAVVLVCSAASAQSFEALAEWRRNVSAADPRARIVVVATQADRRPRAVPRQALEDFCGREVPLFEVTAVDRELVESMFARLLDTVLTRAEAAGDVQPLQQKKEKEEKKKRGKLTQPLLGAEGAADDENDGCCCGCCCT